MLSVVATFAVIALVIAGLFAAGNSGQGTSSGGKAASPSVFFVLCALVVVAGLVCLGLGML